MKGLNKVKVTRPPDLKRGKLINLRGNNDLIMEESEMYREVSFARELDLLAGFNCENVFFILKALIHACFLAGITDQTGLRS